MPATMSPVSLKDSDIRASVDERNEKIGRKIRDAELAENPVHAHHRGERSRSGPVSVREHGQGDLGTMSLQILRRNW